MFVRFAVLLFLLNKLFLVQSQRSFAAQMCSDLYKNISDCGLCKEKLVVSSRFAKEREFPHACLIGFEASEDDFDYLCSGSLITERFVLSAGHCAYSGLSRKAKFVKIGNIIRGKPNSNTYSYEIIERFKHPNYTIKSIDNDIALFKLDRDVQFNDFVRPICLPTQDENPDKAMLSSWGSLEYAESVQNMLKKFTMETFTQAECQNIYPRQRKIKNGIDYKIMRCYGSHTIGGIDACSGDSGAPLQIYNPDNCAYTVIGIVVHRFIECGKIGVPGIYTRVYPYVDWIQSVIDPNRNGEEIVKPSCSAEEILGHNIVSRCENENNLQNCEGNLDVDTEAKTSCKLGYKTLSRRRTLKTECLVDGSWSDPTVNCYPKCGIMNKKISTELIVGGHKVNNTEFPWNVAIYRNQISKKNLVRTDIFICGGSIISDKVVISAAHCFFRQKHDGNVALEKLELFNVAAGKYFRDINAIEYLPVQLFNVSAVRGVEGYNGYEGLFTADIALVILADRIRFSSHILPVCLDYDHRLGLQSRIPVGQTGSFCGFGWTEFDGESSLELKSLDISVVSHQECKNTSEYFSKFITPDKICAGNKDGQAACQGDSGSGLVFPKIVGGTTAYYLRGIVSNSRTLMVGAGGCDVHFYTLFTNVHVYISNIEEVVREFASN